MSEVGQKERATQNRVVKLFQDQLKYDYLGNWEEGERTMPVEDGLLCDYLTRKKYDGDLIQKALTKFYKALALGEGKNLYEANKAVYDHLRYGVKVKKGVGEQTDTVWLIDWKNPLKNDFAIAEEVSVKGEHKKRPDIVLYVNGIALGILELKRSSVSVSEGIRQNLDNQKKTFIRKFFTTMQLVMAGNDTEGLRYGTIETPEKYYLNWKEEDPDYNAQIDEREKKYLSSTECEGASNPLDVALLRMCNKTRLLELIHDFIVFDTGTKKACRHNQYFGVHAAQKRVKEREGGIIWHTQGSGKSLTMVWLAKWIREHVKDSRVLVITDRTELDEQIEGVFLGVDEDIYRTTSGTDLIATLNEPNEWLICSLVHKFGGCSEKKMDAATEEFIKVLKESVPKDFRAKGELFIFVDECHRTQSGKLHKAMQQFLPNAMFYGFTGTPLLKRDKETSIEVFGTYIHTYKFDEAVADGVVLDLRYEARDVDQYVSSPKKIDEWFELKTKGLSDMAKFQLKQRWGTMKKVLSSQDRLGQIVNDILMDMERKPRLMDGRGNAMLVCSSIYQACKVYDLFSKTDMAGKCAIVTSYLPSTADIKGEESGEGMTEQLRKYDIYRKMLADHFEVSEEAAMNRAEEFEKAVKKRFVKEPGQMKLLIVVDKLLTGFDAPSATYLYIDKTMHDHGLFQAICRVNRLDGEDKEYGYVIDYKDLFHHLEGAVDDYTSGALDGYDAKDVAGLLTNRLEKAKEKMGEAREVIKALCEPVLAPKSSAEYQHYFCAEDTVDKDALRDNEPKRVALYKAVASLARAYANLANEMTEAGFTNDQAKAIKGEVEHYTKVMEEVKLGSGDYLDMKMFEPAMRHLLDTYIRAEDSEVISDFEDLGLVELIVKNGLRELDKLPKGIRDNQQLVAETIENNIRKVIIDEQPVNPKYYDQMSQVLEALIKERREGALEYQAYLEKIKALAKNVVDPGGDSTTEYPRSLNSRAKRSLYDNLDQNEQLAIVIDEVVRTTKKANWVGHKFKEKEVANAVREVLDEQYHTKLDDIMDLLRNQVEYQ
ncbi:HsdR family type I site-specific deoxyribonuclease [Pontiellaceae bacterium B12227]|nr:HsdR family type I site-specific deoxyribonuclease [Pontiellaceae bacterium B12227]